MADRMTQTVGAMFAEGMLPPEEFSPVALVSVLKDGTIVVSVSGHVRGLLGDERTGKLMDDLAERIAQETLPHT